MRLEIWEEECTGSRTAVVLDGDEVVAINFAFEREEADNLMKQFHEDNNVYTKWEDTYAAENIAECDFEHYDEDGEAIDLNEHPWTMDELYEDVTSYSYKLRPYYVVAVTIRHGEDGDEFTEGRFIELEDAVQFARKYWDHLNDFDKKHNRVEVRQYEEDIEDADCCCFDHDTFDWQTVEDRTVIRSCYSEEADTTFIMKDIFKQNGEVESVECVGFYFGEPNGEYTHSYIGKLKATLE